MVAVYLEWSDDVQALLESLAMQHAIQPLAGLDERLGILVTELEPILAEARALDLVADWADAPCGPALMLTSTAANHLDLELLAPADRGIGTKTGCAAVRWIRRGEASNEFSTPQYRVHGEVTATDAWSDENFDFGIDSMADPRALGADVLASQVEDALRLAARHAMLRQAELDRWTPLLILGIRQSWPITNEPDGTCGVCHGRRLERQTLCLHCLRSGVDGLLGPVPKTIVRHTYRPGKVAGGIGGKPKPKKYKYVPPKPKVSKAKRKARAKAQPKAQTMLEFLTPDPAPKSAWRTELDAMKAAAKGK